MSSSTKGDSATEAFVKETLREEVDVQEDIQKDIENAGNSSSSSTDENIEHGIKYPDLNKSPTAMVDRSQATKTHNEGSRSSTSGTGHGSNLENNIIETSKDHYHLPTSNLPHEFRLGFSPTSIQVPQGGNWMSGSSSLANINWSTKWQPYSQLTTPLPATTNLGPQGFGFQALLNQVIASNNFHVNNDKQIHQYVASSPFQLDGTSSNPNKRKMITQDDIPPTPTTLSLFNWIPIEGKRARNNNIVSTSSSSRSKTIRNKVYDPSYAAMGLQVDPHLRVFLARLANIENKDNGNNNNGEDCVSKAISR